MKPSIRAIIVDDESNAIVNLQHNLSRYCPDIEVIATAGTINEAQSIIDNNQFDVAFLDIQLCKDNIFTLVNSLEKINFHIVFVTAYDSFAIKAFKVDALDYLLKPLAKEDITACYKKIQKKLQKPGASSVVVSKRTPVIEPRKIIVRQGDMVFVIKQTDVYYLKAKGFYTEVHFEYDHKVITALISKPISTLEKEYDCPLFFRIHKSYIVNVQEVKHIHKTEVVDIQLRNNVILPVAKRRVSDFLRFVNETTA